MLRSLSTRLIVRGAVAMAVGIVAIAWPGITVAAFVFVFAIYAFAEALIEGATAFLSDSAGPVVGHLVLAVLDIAAAVIAVVWPGITVFALVLWVAAWAVVTGVIEVATAFRAGETAGERAMWGIAGATSVVFGVVLFAHPRVGALCSHWCSACSPSPSASATSPWGSTSAGPDYSGA